MAKSTTGIFARLSFIDGDAKECLSKETIKYLKRNPNLITKYGCKIKEIIVEVLPIYMRSTNAWFWSFLHRPEVSYYEYFIWEFVPHQFSSLECIKLLSISGSPREVYDTHPAKL